MHLSKSRICCVPGSLTPLCVRPPGLCSDSWKSVQPIPSQALGFQPAGQITIRSGFSMGEYPQFSPQVFQSLSELAQCMVIGSFPSQRVLTPILAPLFGHLLAQLLALSQESLRARCIFAHLAGLHEPSFVTRPLSSRPLTGELRTKANKFKSSGTTGALKLRP